MIYHLKIVSTPEGIWNVTIDTNPVKKLREYLGYSQEELSFQSGINRQVIVRVEQGCYASIPPRLNSYLVARMGDGSSSLAADYFAWVDEKRRNAFGQLTSGLPEFTTNKHPFVAWREASGISRIEFAKEFCVHLSTLGRFETNLQQQSVPWQLIEALLASGYTAELVHDLQIRFKLYRDFMLSVKFDSIEKNIAATHAIEKYLNNPAA